MIHVLDASALLAVSKGERGAQLVMDLTQEHDCVVSSVNVAEVASKLCEWGMPVDKLQSAIAQFGVDVVDFNQEQALACAALRSFTKSAGLSLGDRACLALAKLMQGVVVTGDGTWSDLEDTLRVKVLRIR